MPRGSSCSGGKAALAIIWVLKATVKEALLLKGIALVTIRPCFTREKELVIKIGQSSAERMMLRNMPVDTVTYQSQEK